MSEYFQIIRKRYRICASEVFETYGCLLKEFDIADEDRGLIEPVIIKINSFLGEVSSCILE